MHIKEIVLEGFKSYASRTVISGFDQQFNAVTGLNGSGKSNIMDSILFVLGLSSLSLARVNNLQEFVYKMGHAGVTKASVTITFDNRNTNTSPVGYEQHKEITVTRQIQNGKSKYFLNGHNETNQKIKNMFKTVQLNIDNPHFVVAQGKITKIINLKPSELIAMIEETAGTALYMDKKNESNKIIQKKSEKVNEIINLLQNEIEPQMEKLRKEKENYMIWKSGQQELLTMNKKIRGFEYFTKQKELVKLKSEHQNSMDKMEKNQEIRTTTKNALDMKKNELIEKKKSLQHGNNEKLKELKKQYEEHEKHQNFLDGELKNLYKLIERGKNELEINMKNRTELKHNIPRLGQKIEQCNQDIVKYEQQYEEKKSQFEDIERRKQQSSNSGQSVQQDLTTQVNAQLIEVNRNINYSEVQLNKKQAKKNGILKEIENIKLSVQRSAQDVGSMQQQIQQITQEIQDRTQDIENVNVNENIYNQKREQVHQINLQRIELENEIQNQNQNQQIFKLNFRNPEPNFDRRKVFGRVFQLITPVEEKFIKALESCAKGKLHNIVVDTEITSKLLMKNKSFQGAETLLPNNKISYVKVPDHIEKQAENIAREQNGKAVPAYKLINYDQNHSQSILHVFGNVFICSNAEIAKSIAYSPCRTKCVTLEGDSFDPSGTLSGGFVNQNQSVLTQYQKVKQIQIKLDQVCNEYENLTRQCQDMQKDLDYVQQIRQEIDQKTQKLKWLKDGLRNISSKSLEEKNQFMEQELQDVEQEISRIHNDIKRFQEERNDLNTELQQIQKSGNSNSNNESMKNMMQEKSKKLHQELQRILQDLKFLKESVTGYEVERDNALNEEKNIIRNIEKYEAEIHKNSMLHAKKEDEHSHVKLLFQETEQLKNKIEMEIKSNDSSIKQLDKNIQELEERFQKHDEDVKKLEQVLKQYEKDNKNLELIISKLEQDFDFILQYRDSFGVVGGEFDFSRFDYQSSVSAYKNLEKDQEQLKKRVNLKVEAMNEKVEFEYQTLIKNRNTLENDKQTLFSNISELDKKRIEAVEKCYLHVNGNFGKIFSTLLPGTTAKIHVQPGKDITDGLEIGVAFGKVWKTSLSELSGGQRSLLALSFMLALLLYKPAPFYILDEIDAALDVSHTENIGLMISKYFPQSQFLIVSLKDGMFNNANVLFKTSFVDGNSKVDRVALKNRNKDKNNDEQM